jgi:hypothetical protein
MIKMMFNELFGDFVAKNYKATKDYNDKHIETAIIMH